MNQDNRIAGAPISWGVCEVPGWGYQMPADQVLRQMSEIGLSATELGPDGFLPADPDELATTLAAHNLHAVGGFTPFVLHPHVGTLVETGPEVRRVLEGSAISLCLDTGHLLIGGTDPAVLAGQVPDRIAHTHLKDVDLAYARKVQAGRLTYTEAVREGMYRPLGTGDVDVAAIVEHLRGNGYDGWYTLEQDTILTEPPSGEGPVADVRTSVDYLRSLLVR